MRAYEVAQAVHEALRTHADSLEALAKIRVDVKQVVTRVDEPSAISRLTAYMDIYTSDGGKARVTIKMAHYSENADVVTFDDDECTNPHHSREPHKHEED